MVVNFANKISSSYSTDFLNMLLNLATWADGFTSLPKKVVEQDFYHP
jgi:hypothetical protein